jgi:hypothetical protein
MLGGRRLTVTVRSHYTQGREKSVTPIGVQSSANPYLVTVAAALDENNLS